MLFQTTLREEGIVIPKKSKLLNGSGRSGHHHYHEELLPAPDNKGHFEVADGSLHRDGPSIVALNSEGHKVLMEHSVRNDHQQEGIHNAFKNAAMHVIARFVSLIDIREVLKDLQILSASLLSIETSEPDPGIGTAASPGMGTGDHN